MKLKILMAGAKEQSTQAVACPGSPAGALKHQYTLGARADAAQAAGT